MDTEIFLRELEKTFAECLEIAKRKNADYAEQGDPFKNFKMSTQVGVAPERAILVRISDKISRVSNLLDKENSVMDERIEDTLHDIINYCAILKALITNNKQNV